MQIPNPHPEGVTDCSRVVKPPDIESTIHTQTEQGVDLRLPLPPHLLLQPQHRIMKDHRVDALAGTHVVEWNMHALADHLPESASGEAGHANGPDLIAVGVLHRAENVRAVAGTGDRHQQVARSAEGPELLREDLVV